MDFTKFVSLMHSRALFFARSDRLGDPFEGSLSRMNKVLRSDIYRGKIDPDKIENIPAAMKSMPQRTFVNCWHESEIESAAMWKLYAKEVDGIAVRTTFGGLSRSFICNDDIYIGRVEYVDYNKTLIPEGNTFLPYLRKRHAFQHEKEVKAISASLGSADSPEHGINHRVELDTLIDEIFVAPFADAWLFELAHSVAERYDVAKPVRRSSLAEGPTW